MSAHTFLKSVFDSAKALPSSGETKQKGQGRHQAFSVIGLTLLFAIGLPFAAVPLDRIVGAERIADHWVPASVANNNHWDGVALANAHWVGRTVANNDHWDAVARANAHWVGRTVANDHWDAVALANTHWVGRSVANNNHWDAIARANVHWVGRTLADNHWDGVALADARLAAAA